jgi:hypothetical protein
VHAAAWGRGRNTDLVRRRLDTMLETFRIKWNLRGMDVIQLACDRDK